MIKDIPENIVQDIGIAVALEGENIESKTWYVYLINLKKEPIENISSIIDLSQKNNLSSVIFDLDKLPNVVKQMIYNFLCEYLENHHPHLQS